MGSSNSVWCTTCTLLRDEALLIKHLGCLGVRYGTVLTWIRRESAIHTSGHNDANSYATKLEWK
jgi:hypothetical protein